MQMEIHRTFGYNKSVNKRKHQSDPIKNKEMSVYENFIFWYQKL